jgi:transcriptional regulator with XRE-family HTH domain
MTTEINEDTVGRRIRRLRHKMGWPQSHVAKQLNMSIPAFSKIETGITDINISRLRQIADLFDVHAAEIFIQGGEQSIITGLNEIAGLQASLEIREKEIIGLQAKLINLYEELDRSRKKS